MDSPIYLRRIVKPDGSETVTGSSARPRQNDLPAKPYIAVVFNGRGRVLDWFAGETEGEASGPALRIWMDRQRQWEALGAVGKSRVPDPPMWDLYVLFSKRYIRQRGIPPIETPDPAPDPAPAPARIVVTDGTAAEPPEAGPVSPEVPAP